MSTSRKVMGLIAVMVSVASCSTSNDDMTDAGTQTSCNQACLDANVGIAIAGLVFNLYNQAIAGMPTGNQTATASCPLGGTATITGTTSLDSGHNLTDVDLTYVMKSCEALENGDTLTFSGSIEMQGSFDSANQETVHFSSSGLQYSGTVGAVAVSGPATCAVHVNDDSNASTHVTGTMCGRTF